MALTEKQIAFPGAEGFGRYTTGGRGGILTASDFFSPFVIS